ncbi:MAG TPA: hypothetical protein VGJ94_13800 [Syntrophorhabdaceae bacterium]
MKIAYGRRAGMGLFGFILLCSLCTAAPCAEIGGQKPVMLIGEVFRFVPGSWAIYSIHDRVKNERYRMYISTLEKAKCEEKTCSWMEVEVAPESGASVASRFLVEETKDGPGRLFEVIIQIKDYIPFMVPRKLYEGKEREVGDFQNSYVAKRVGRKTILWEGKSITVTEVEATDKKARKISALVSEEVPPLGIVKAEAEKTDIFLEKWGEGAKTKMEGTPVNLALWLIKQIGQGVMK